MARNRPAGAVALLAVIGATACVDSGLPGKNLPLEQARHREWSYPLYQEAVQPSGLPDLVPFDDGLWALRAAPLHELGLETALTRNPELLRPVSTGSAALSAFAWDEAPYDRLFLQTESGLRTYDRVY